MQDPLTSSLLQQQFHRDGIGISTSPTSNKGVLTSSTPIEGWKVQKAERSVVVPPRPTSAPSHRPALHPAAPTYLDVPCLRRVMDQHCQREAKKLKIYSSPQSHLINRRAPHHRYMMVSRGFKNRKESIGVAPQQACVFYHQDTFQQEYRYAFDPLLLSSLPVSSCTPTTHPKKEISRSESQFGVAENAPLVPCRPSSTPCASKKAVIPRRPQTARGSRPPHEGPTVEAVEKEEGEEVKGNASVDCKEVATTTRPQSARRPMTAGQHFGALQFEDIKNQERYPQDKGGEELRIDGVSCKTPMYEIVVKEEDEKNNHKASSVVLGSKASIQQMPLQKELEKHLSKEAHSSSNVANPQRHEAPSSYAQHRINPLDPQFLLSTSEKWIQRRLQAQRDFMRSQETSLCIRPASAKKETSLPHSLPSGCHCDTALRKQHIKKYNMSHLNKNVLQGSQRQSYMNFYSSKAESPRRAANGSMLKKQDKVGTLMAASQWRFVLTADAANQQEAVAAVFSPSRRRSSVSSPASKRRGSTSRRRSSIPLPFNRPHTTVKKNKLDATIAKEAFSLFSTPRRTSAAS